MIKNKLKFLWVSLIVISCILSVLIIASAFVLNKFSNSSVDRVLISSAGSTENTALYARDSSFNSECSDISLFVESARIDNGIKHKYITYDKIPNELVNAFISIEDKRFSKHRGVDYLRSCKAAINYIFGGSKTFGGSTITQQLVKNLTYNDEFSIERKIIEAFAAIDLESKYDKTEILEMYLNIINLSNGCRGVEAASQYFFSKSAAELTLSESATIAAITNNPSKYDPIRHPENTVNRRNTVLLCMLEQGYINEREYSKASQEPIKLDLSKQNLSKPINSWYTDMVIEDVIKDLSEKYGISKSNASIMLHKGGYNIYTAMDISVQTVLEEYYENTNNFISPNAAKTPQSSMIIIDPYSGDILAVAGGIGEKKGNRIQNYAVNTKRPPGSAIKPLSVYAPAFEKGIIHWATVLEDSPVIKNPENSYLWPMNANKKFAGRVNIKYAIENSLNTVPVKILREIGNEASFDFLTKKLLINSLDRSEDMGDASLALGQPSKGISLKELVSAYTIFQEGVMSNARSYYKVTDKNGNIVLDNAPEQSSVLSRENAAIMTKLMQNAVEQGTASGMIELSQNIEVAGKTGTTQYNNDKYFVGYTPTLLAGVWLGYEYPEPLSGYGGNFSAIIWDDVMSRIYSNTEYKNSNTTFNVPKTVQKLVYDKTTGESPNIESDPSNFETGWFVLNN